MTVSYAVTVVQGLTLKKAAIDIGSSIFTAGQAYVALSRVPSLEDVIVLDFVPNVIYASVKVKEEMARLRSERCIITCRHSKKFDIDPILINTSMDIKEDVS